MLKFPICQDEINILYLRDIEHLLENESIHLLVVEQLDSTYSIFPLYQYCDRNISDSYHRLAYNYDHLTIEHQLQYQNSYRHMKKNGNGTYYEAIKKYIKKSEL